MVVQYRLGSSGRGKGTLVGGILKIRDLGLGEGQCPSWGPSTF